MGTESANMAHHKEPYPISEIIEISKGFKGLYTETGRDGSQSLHVHIVWPPF